MGDEPGTFGDATFVGLGVELPLTVHAMQGAASDAKPLLKLVLHLENMKAYEPYPGHALRVIPHVPVAGTDPPQWKEGAPILDVVLPREGNEFSHDILLGDLPLPAFLSVQLYCNVNVAPGLYNDFVFTRVSAGDPKFACYATFGFEYDAH